MRKLVWKTFIYLKKHNPTSTYYLGVTNNPRPWVYMGSGVAWRKILREHGLNGGFSKDITTYILLETLDEAELILHCHYYSNLWNIVDNPNFANMITEKGTKLPTRNYYGYENSGL